jgi:hypothetical protein
VAPAYSEVLSAAGAGPKTLAERIAASPAFQTFFLKRETAQTVASEVPPSEEETKVGQWLLFADGRGTVDHSTRTCLTQHTWWFLGAGMWRS